MIFSLESSIALSKEIEELSFCTEFVVDKVFPKHSSVNISSGYLFEPFSLLVSITMEIKLVNQN